MMFKVKSTLTKEQLDDAGIPNCNRWVIGNLNTFGELSIITGGISTFNNKEISFYWLTVVEKDTVGQDTGFYDINLNSVYEGDWIRYKFTSLEGNEIKSDVQVRRNGEQEFVAGDWLLSHINQKYEVLPDWYVEQNKGFN